MPATSRASPFDTLDRLLRDLEIFKRELAVEVVEIFYLTPLPGSEDHKRLTDAGIWMDPDMNKYALSERVTHHPKMSDEEWEGAFEKAWNSTTAAAISRRSWAGRGKR